MSHDQGHIPQKFEVIFVGFTLMKNIIFNKTKSLQRGKHACQFHFSLNFLFNNMYAFTGVLQMMQTRIQSLLAAMDRYRM